MRNYLDQDIWWTEIRSSINCPYNWKRCPLEHWCQAEAGRYIGKFVKSKGTNSDVIQEYMLLKKCDIEEEKGYKSIFSKALRNTVVQKYLRQNMLGKGHNRELWVMNYATCPAIYDYKNI